MLDFALGVGRVAGIIVGVIALLLVAGMIWESLAGQADARRFPAPGRMVEVGGGRQMHILCKGNAPGPTVVLEMGAAESSPYWWAIQDEIARFARVCSYDRAGYGWSNPSTAPITLEARAADLHAVLKASGAPGPYVLAGHSLGGPLIRLYARDHLEEVAGFAFIDTPDEAGMFRDGYLDFVRKGMKPMLSATGLARRFGLLRAMTVFSGRNPFDPSNASADTLHALAAVRTAAMLETGIAEVDAILGAPAGLRREHGFGGPVGDRPVAVVTHGQKFPPPYDVLEVGWDEGQKRLAALSTNSEIIVAEKANHMIQDDQPEVVVDAIRRVWLAARDGTRLDGRAPVLAAR